MSIASFPAGKDPRGQNIVFPQGTPSPVESVWGLPAISFPDARENKDEEFYERVFSFGFLFGGDEPNKAAGSEIDKPSDPKNENMRFVTPSQEVIISLALIGLVGISLLTRSK